MSVLLEFPTLILAPFVEMGLRALTTSRTKAPCEAVVTWSQAGLCFRLHVAPDLEEGPPQASHRGALVSLPNGFPQRCRRKAAGQRAARC